MQARETNRMSKSGHSSTMVTCVCERTALRLIGPPIMTVACYCNSCRVAADLLGRRPGAPRMTEEDGGTHFVMQRKDRVECVKGRTDLHEHRLSPGASTRRVIASCCNTAMFLDFEPGHWLSVYANRIDPDERPLIEQRTMTGDRPHGVPFDDGIPSAKTRAPRFMWRLLTTWAVMGFKMPKIDFVGGALSD